MRSIHVIVFISAFFAASTLAVDYTNCKCQDASGLEDNDKTSLCCRLLQVLGVQGTDNKYPGPNNQCVADGAYLSGDDFNECCGYYNRDSFCW